MVDMLAFEMEQQDKLYCISSGASAMELEWGDMLEVPSNQSWDHHIVNEQEAEIQCYFVGDIRSFCFEMTWLSFSMVDMLAFEMEQQDKLYCISSGASATSEIERDVILAEAFGHLHVI
jgi:uncharacterized cupin superfamily protein